MKKLILLFLLISTSAFSRNVINTFECGQTVVKFYDDNTCDVGGLTYEIQFQPSVENNKDVFYFLIAGHAMLLGYHDEFGHLVIFNTDDTDDKRYFIKCN